MRITFVLPYAGLQGGIRVVAIYAQRLMRRGHTVTVISDPQQITIRDTVKGLLRGTGWPQPEPSHFDGTGVEHRVLPTPRPVTNADVPDGDVVVATYYTTAEGVLRLAPAKGAKALFIQNYEVEQGQPNPRLDLTWRMPLHKITISRWLVDLARERFGDAQVSHVPNSVDVNQFHAPPRQKRPVPTVGLLYKTFSLKGLDTSLRAFRRVAGALPAVRLIAFGAERPHRKFPLPAHAEFHYRPHQALLRELYAECDVWMCGSNVEGFHLPPLEAMACRCPVASTRVGGPMDIVQDGVNGHLVDVKDAEALGDRVLRILTSPEDRWRQMSDAAYSTARGYSWDDATRLFERALSTAIARNTGNQVTSVEQTLSVL